MPFQTRKSFDLRWNSCHLQLMGRKSCLPNLAKQISWFGPFWSIAVEHGNDSGIDTSAQSYYHFSTNHSAKVETLLFFFVVVLLLNGTFTDVDHVMGQHRFWNRFVPFNSVALCSAFSFLLRLMIVFVVVIRRQNSVGTEHRTRNEFCNHLD